MIALTALAPNIGSRWALDGAFVSLACALLELARCDLPPLAGDKTLGVVSERQRASLLGVGQRGGAANVCLALFSSSRRASASSRVG